MNISNTNNATYVAAATIRGSSLAPSLRGTVVFTPWQNGTQVTVAVMGLPKGSNFYAFHIHEGVACGKSQTDNPYQAAGDHYNPGNTLHPMHAGDLPALLSTENGSAWMSVITDRFTPDQVIGHTVVIHAQPDDYHTQPSGNAGSRIGCGEIDFA